MEKIIIEGNNEELYNWCVLNSEDIIENIIVASKKVANKMKLHEFYNTARIGDKYNPDELISAELTPESAKFLSQSLNLGINEI